MKPLQSERNTREVERRVLSAARQILGLKRPSAVFEHGHWWICNNRTGAQWDAVDAEGGQSVLGFDFERVSDGEDE